VTGPSKRTAAAEAEQVYRASDRLFDRDQVEGALDTMGRAISRTLGGTDPVVLCVMNGGLVPLGRLLTRLEFPLQLDYLHATRYRGDTVGGRLQWVRRNSTPLVDRVVLIVDDILDEGLTLAAIASYCGEAGAERVLSAVLVEKLHDRGNGFTADFVGLQVPDRYVFGYGMDYHGYLRNAPGIFAVAGDAE